MSYKISILVLLIVIILNTSLAAEKSLSHVLPDPILLLLGEEKKYHPDEPEQFSGCWNADGAFIPNDCEAELYECSIEDSFVTKPLLDLKVFPGKAKNLSSAVSLDVSVPGIYEWNNNVQKFGAIPWRTLPRAPEGAIAIIYEGSYSNEFDIYGRMKIPASGELVLSGPLLAHQSVTLELGDGWPNNTEIRSEIFGKHFASGGHGKPISFKLAEGDYEVRVLANSNGRHFESIIPMRIGKTSKETLIFKVNFNQFRDITNNRNSYSTLAWSENILGYFDSGPIEYGFEKVSSIEIVTNKTEVTPFFELKNSKLILKNKSAFEKAIQDLPIYKIRISGTCGTYSKKSKMGEYEVFNRPSDKAIGKLSIFTLALEPNKVRIEYRDSLTQKVVPFVPNIISKSKEIYHQALSIDNKFANLGEGPWGAEGWAQVPVVSLFNKDIVYFKNKENESIEFFKSKSGVFFKRIVSDFNPYKDDIFEGRLIDSNSSELLDEKGLLKFVIKERVINGRDMDKYPSLVDLTDSKISVKNSNSTSSVEVYEAPDVSSKRIGEIRYSNQKGTLRGIFINGGKEISLNSDYFEGRCGGSYNHVAFQNVLETHNEFSRIGKGPWGEGGWVRARRYKINDERLSIKFKMSDLWNVESLFYFEDKVEVSLVAENSSTSRTLTPNDIYEAGRLKLIPICPSSKEMNLSNFKEPHYVYLGPAIESDGDFTPQQSMNVFYNSDLNSKKIGEIIFRDEELYFKNVDGKEVVFKSNIHSGYCDSLEKRLYIHQVWSDKKNWADLGKGLWGDHGWVNVDPLPIINSDLFFKFNTKYSTVKLSHGAEKQLVMTQSYDLAKDEIRYIELEDLISPDGKLKLPANCERDGC